jgi:hypothetical protein
MRIRTCAEGISLRLLSTPLAQCVSDCKTSGLDGGGPTHGPTRRWDGMSAGGGEQFVDKLGGGDGRRLVAEAASHGCGMIADDSHHIQPHLHLTLPISYVSCLRRPQSRMQPVPLGPSPRADAATRGTGEDGSHT